MLELNVVSIVGGVSNKMTETMIGVPGACVDVDETWTGTMQGVETQNNHTCIQHILGSAMGQCLHGKKLIRQGKHTPRSRERKYQLDFQCEIDKRRRNSTIRITLFV
jgi:hypothetical protein